MEDKRAHASAKERSFYTYLHCKPNGAPFYVGKGCRSTGGERSHKFSGRNKHHQNIVAKHGKNNIKIYVFQCNSEQQAKVDEIQKLHN